MRVLAATLAVLLLVAICSLAEANPRVARHRSFSLKQGTICCTTYTSHHIPVRVISAAYMTSNSCPKPAVVLVTRKGRQVCADPTAHWVQEYLKQSELLEY